MSTLSKPVPTSRSILRANPVLNRLGKVKERSETDAASYSGIAAKTTFFLAVTLIGMIAQLLVKAAMAGEPVWQTIKVYEKFTLTLSVKEAAIVGGVMIVGLICELLGLDECDQFILE